MKLRQKKSDYGKRSNFHYYSSSKEVSRPQNDTTKTLQKPGIKFAIIAGIIVALVLVFANLYVDTGNVTIKVAQKGFGHSQEEYAKKTTELLGNNPLNKTKFSLDYNKIEQGIEASFPEVGDVRITAPIVGSKITVNIVLSEPVLVIINDSGQFLVSRQGNVISQVNKSYDELPQVFDRSSVILDSGQYALTGDQVKFILELEKMFDQKGKSIESFELPEKTTNQLSVKLTGVDYNIKYSFSLDSNLQTGKYFALLPTLEQGTKPKKYVDLRVGERAYVK